MEKQRETLRSLKRKDSRETRIARKTLIEALDQLAKDKHFLQSSSGIL